MKFWKSKKQRVTVNRPTIQKRKSASFARKDLIQKRRNENFKRQFSRYIPILNKLKILIIPIVALTTIIVALSILSKSEIFQVSDYKILTDNTENQEELVSYTKSFFETNNYFASESALQKYLNESIGNVQNVYIRKSLNQGLEIEVIFKSPEFYLINFSGTYILSPQGQVVDIFSEGIEIPYSDLEKKYLANELTPEAEEIRSIYLSRIEEVEQRDRIVWKDVPLEEKVKILQETVDSIQTKKDSYIAAQFKKIQESKYSNLTGFRDYKDDKYELEDYFDSDRLLFMQNLNKEFQKRDLTHSNINWISEFSLSLESTSISNSTKQIIFSLKRSLEDQFKDVDTLIFYNRAVEYRIIDLRSENYVLIR